MIGQGNLFDESDEYRDFVEKFKPKKTTDDCYTPDAVYDAVADWVASEYGIGRADMMRPFYPGGDYENEEYPEGCCVVDNPPFSILSSIVRNYNQAGVRYFLFAPTLTNFTSRGCSHIVCGASVTYENGAVVNTSFVTNLDRWKVRSAPDLLAAIESAQDVEKKPALPKYAYPDNVLTAAKVAGWAKFGIDYRLDASECCRVGTLDAQRKAGKSIFGDGYLLSNAGAEEASRAAKKAAESVSMAEGGVCEWKLSSRELSVIESLG